MHPVVWLEETLAALRQQPAIGYMPGGAPAAEPTAVAAIALKAYGELTAAAGAGDALLAMQQSEGAVGVRSGEPSPGWPTSLAVAAWCAVDRQRYAIPIEQGVAWLLANRGRPIPRSADFGHNTELVGWAYAENTHSWIEPTALAVVALTAAGQAAHPAVSEAVALLIDRQLPGGGWNYGNTYVFGQLLRAHLQPSGLALLALAHASDSAGNRAAAGNSFAKSIAWLAGHLGRDTTSVSLGWGLLGLGSYGVVPSSASEGLSIAAGKLTGNRAVSAERPLGDVSLHKLALLALAAKGWPR
jgi:hypothetical protein